jgi:large repetitive protein
MPLIAARIRKSVTAAVIVALVGALTVLVGAISPAPDAFAIPGQGTPFDCSGGVIYNVQTGSGSTGILNALTVSGMAGTTPVPGAPVNSAIPNNTPNALGISAGGTAAWMLAPNTATLSGTTLTFTVREYNPITQAWSTFSASANTAGTGVLPPGVTAGSISSIVAGAVDPLSGNFYWAYYANATAGSPNGSITFFGFNTTTNTSLGIVARSTLPQALPLPSGGANGDFAFDSQGNVYVVSSIGTNAALGRIPGPLPTTPQTSPPVLTDTRLATYPNSNSNAYNGIAFDNTGNLYLEYSSGSSTAILKVDPATGATLAGPATVSYSGTGGTIGTDLGGCSVPPVMELEKNVVNRQAPTDQFNLSITGGGITGGNTATTSGTATGVQAAVAGPVVRTPSTTYSFAETGAGTTNLADYTTTWRCVDDAFDLLRGVVASGTGQSFQLTLGPGEAGQFLVCTFTNTTLALTLVKQVDNGTSGATTAATAWTLTAAGTTTGLPTITGPTGSATVTNAFVQAGTYNLSEAGPVGYSPSTWACTGATSSTATTVTVALGQNVTCTITNTAIPPTLTLVKEVVNAHGGTQIDTAWTLTAAGPVTITGITGSAEVTGAPVRIGTYDLSESGPAGYSASPWDCTGATSFTATSVTLALAQNATCTVTNSDIPPRLTLVKHVVNDHGGAAVATDWTLTAAGPVTISGATGSTTVTSAAVSAGTYTLSEAGGPAGYSASAWSCTGATGFTADTVMLALDEDVTCEITNTDIAPTLTLVKEVDENGSGANTPATAWTLTAAGPVRISGATGSPDVTDAIVHAGTYDLTESGPPGYTASAWDCTGATSSTAGSVTLALAQNATCIIVNTAIPPVLTLVKVVNNVHGGTAVPTDWTLTAAGPVTISGATASTDVTGATVQIGTYHLSESGPPGYSASAWRCVNAAGHPIPTPTPTSVSLALAADVTCTITNTDIAPRLTLVKNVVNTHGGTAAATDWTLTAGGPVTISGATGSTDVTNAAVDAGTYTLSESGPPGYSTSGWSCTGATDFTATSVTLDLAEHATCQITNTDIAPTLTLVKRVLNTHGGTAVPTDWTLTAAGPVTISGATGSPEVTGAAVNAGVYLLSESGGPDGYTPSVWRCIDSATGLTVPGPTPFTVRLALAQNVTCTIINADIPTFLTLVKHVDNGTTGATAVATDWTLAAIGPQLISGVTGSPDVTAAPATPGTYNLTESGPRGYTPSAWSCVGATSSTATSVTVALNQNVTCTITNTAIPPELTLVKKVVNGTTGATVPATAWTLSAKGPTELSGATGSTAVTGAVIQVGTYQLSETGPTGYKVSTWACTGAASSSAASVTIAVGNHATCTITNTAIDPRLTLVKQVVNTYGGTAIATEWTLTAAGPITIDGATGTTPVTNAVVPAGAYRLTESGPSGYTASSWTCTGATLDGSTVEIVSGTVAVCTIVNTQNPPSAVIETPAASAAPPAGSGTLAFTGENMLGELEVGLAAAFIGGLFLFANRRRRK